MTALRKGVASCFSDTYIALNIALSLKTVDGHASLVALVQINNTRWAAVPELPVLLNVESRECCPVVQESTVVKDRKEP